MLNNIFFIGGIHGVGKSTICKELCAKLNLQYLSASEVLKWKDINEDIKNKKVIDIPHTQDLLVNGLMHIVREDQNYLLDGHYCLLNKEGVVNEIPFETFKRINPVSLSLIIGDIQEIKGRLELRDSRSYDSDLLNGMQSSEIDYAKLLSQRLNVPLNIGHQHDYRSVLNSLQEQIATK